MRLRDLVRTPNPGQFWLIVFGCWILFISGFFAGFVGSPGVIQAIRLQSLLESKNLQVAELREELQKLHAEAVRLEKVRPVQEREIRRVLGYAASDEIIFDFTGTEPSQIQ